MADEILKRDQNHITVLGGITDDSDQEIRMLRVDPLTNRLLVTAVGGGGGISTISNLGTGEGVFAQINSGDAQFKSLVAGTNVTITSDADEITINSTGGGGGSDTWVTDDLTSQVDGIVNVFSLSETPKSGSPFQVFASGQFQMPSVYSVTGTDLTLTYVPPVIDGVPTPLLIYYIQA